MEKCKIYDQSKKEVATILIFQVDNHKVGIILTMPYLANVIKEAYAFNVDDKEIIDNLLNKASLINISIKCN